MVQSAHKSQITFYWICTLSFELLFSFILFLYFCLLVEKHNLDFLQLIPLTWALTLLYIFFNSSLVSEQKTLLLKVFQLKFESSGIYFKFGNIRFQEEQPDKIQLNMGSCVVTKINIKY